MIENIDALLKEVQNHVVHSKEDIEQFRIKYLSKKGIIPGLFQEFKNIEASKRKEFGQKLNDLKNVVQSRIEEFKSKLDQGPVQSSSDTDLSLPGDIFKPGSRHPVSIVRNEIITIFSRLGFTVSEGPEIEDDDHVFSKLNFPPEHPARDMQDTFLFRRISAGIIAIRMIFFPYPHLICSGQGYGNQKPPIRTISPGRVFRNEAISARAHCIFHQVEGLYIDKMYLLPILNKP